MASTATPSETTQPGLPTAKLTAVARLMSFTGSIVPKREEKPKLQFPPPSWNIEDYETSPSSTASTPSRSPDMEYVSPKDGHAPPLSAPSGSTAINEQHVEPITFAMRLRSMIEALPIPAKVSIPSTPPATEMQSIPPHAQDSPTPPLPPDIDPNLVKILSSEDIMNGDAGADGKGKNTSIWNILAGLGKSDKDGANTDTGSIPSSVEAEDAGGVMMYAPLEPKADSRVSLAEAGVIHETSPSTVSKVEDKLKDILHSSRPNTPAEKRVWVPSTTELSVLTAWWGYRLYLPPPIMAKLGASSVKAAARAAMVTTALKWMLDKIPMAVVPPQFKPAVKMLKTLAPIAGYVGVFIAWSWDRIKLLDEGNGVVLTATWLLPVALLPMAWDAGAIYQPILLPDPEEIQKAEEAAKAGEGSKDDKSSKVKGGDGDGKDKKKNKSKFKFW